MKKNFLVTALFLGIFVMAFAQPRAIGGRLGWNLEASYQHSLGNNFIEVDAGLIDYGRGIQASGIFDFVIASPDWTSQGEWNFYAGPGISLGYRWHDKLWGNYNYEVNYDGRHYDSWTSAAIVGVAGQIGLDYTFKFNLQLAVDYRPVFGVALGDGAGSWDSSKGEYRNARFYQEGLYDFAISVRYCF